MKNKFRRVISAIIATAITSAMLILPAQAAIVDGWSITFQNKCIGTAEVDVKEFCNGNGSLKVTCDSPGANSTFVKISQYVEVEEGKKYYIGGNFKSEGITSVFWTVDWGKRWNANTFGSVFDWKNFEVVYTAEKTGKVEFILAVQDYAKGVWVDDIRFIDAETNKNLIINGGFDSGDAEYQSVMNNFPSSFTEEDFLKTKAGIKYMPVYMSDSIQIDGKADEWEEYGAIKVPAMTSQFKIYINDGSERDMKGEYKFAYDEKYFYMLLMVEDDQFTYVPGSFYWQGDSMQFTISSMDESYGTELGIAYNPNTGDGEIYGANLTEEQSKEIKFEATQSGNITVYEIAVPWSLKFSERPDRIMFDVLANENDGSGRKSALEIVPGIASGKTNAQFPVFEMMRDDKEWFTWMEGPKTGVTKSELTYTYFIMNTSDTAAVFNVKNEDGTEEQVEVKANSGVSKNILKTFEEEGTHSVSVEISNGENIQQISATTELERNQPSVDETKDIVKVMREQATEIENLIKKCEKAGIPTDYEKPAVHILNQFAIYLEEDMTTNDRSRVYYTLETTTAIYNEAKTNLQGYLDGTKSAKEVKKFISSDVTINGQSTYATVGDESGLEERPVYFVGYGHSDYLTPYIEQFKDYGMNTIQNEAGTAYCIKINDLVDWQAVRRANGDIVKSTNVVKIGSGAAKLSFTDEPKEENFVSLLQYVNVEPGKTYEFKGSVKGDGVFGAYADISEYGFNKSTSLDGTYDWKDFSVIYTVPEGLTRLAAQVVVENATSGLYLDNLSVCEVGKSENLLKNGDFEETEGLGLKFDKDAVQDKINILKNQYELSEKNDISFDLNLSIQKSWTADIQEYSKEYGIATQDGLLIKVAHCSHKFTPTHPKTNELVELYLRNYVDMIKDVECIDSFCISNEPQLDASAHGEYFLADWQNYLKERYNNDIAYLNKCYKTEYSDFEEIGFYNPQDKRPAMYYDQKKFNDKVLGNWHRWMAAIVKEYIPDAVMHSKIMGYTFDRTHLYNGTGYEEYTDFYDANGSDYWDYIDDNIGPVAKQMWYDYMTSLKDAPVYNSEDHVIRDSNQTFIPEQATHVGQDIYQNAVHGRARTQIWLWQRDTASHVWGSLLYRPDVIWEISKSALDINRNAYELTALQNQDREVGIIYSDASILNDEFSMPALYEAYASALYNGQRVMFVTETQPEKMMGRKLVIVPKQRYVNEATINYLKAYIENGGRVVILDEESLKLNEYNLENDAEKVKFIFDNSLVIPYEGGSAKMTSPDPVEFNKTIRNILKEENAFYVSVVDADTKEPVYDMEYNLGVYEGDILVNINNYGEHKNISVMFGDKPVTEAYELRSEEMLGEVIGIDKYQSITLKIKNNHTFLDAIGHWGENNIAELAEKNIVSGVSDSKYNPDAVLTRAQFLALMIRASGGNNSYYKNNVPDVENDAWYATSVAAGVEKGIIPAGVNFRPDEPITREDMCVMLVGFYEAAKGTIEASKEAEFSDSEKITAKEAVNKAVAKELIFGHSDGKFAPQGSATRAEAAAVVSRFIAK